MRKQAIHIILFSGFLCASGFAQSAVGRNTLEPWAQERANSCATGISTLLDIVAWDRDGQHHEVSVWQLPDSPAFFFVSGMTIDADGAPNAYNPENTGLDELANAGEPGHWNGIVTDREGNPLIQREADPFPGYYISCTSLSDETKKSTDPTGYVDASKIPYVVLPEDVADRRGARLGDFAVVMNLRNGKSSFAIYADIGTLGEGSVALADNLGIRSDARHGGSSDGILYLLFPGSGNLRPRTNHEIQSAGKMLLSDWGVTKKLFSCAESDDQPRRGLGHNTSSVQKPLQSLDTRDILDRYRGEYFVLDPLLPN